MGTLASCCLGSPHRSPLVIFFRFLQNHPQVFFIEFQIQGQANLARFDRNPGFNPRAVNLFKNMNDLSRGPARFIRIGDTFPQMIKGGANAFGIEFLNYANSICGSFTSHKARGNFPGDFPAGNNLTCPGRFG